MITLLTYPGHPGVFSFSPFCTKAAWLLTMTGLPWTREDTRDPRKMPYGKLPAIRTDNRIVADSEGIRAYLENLGTDFDKGLSDLDRATSRAFIRMAEEHIYFHLLQDRWGDDAVWARLREMIFGELPWPMRRAVSAMVRRQVLGGLHSQGVARFSEADRMHRIEPDLASIATRLWHGAFLFGDRLTAADVSVAAVLSAIRATPGDTALRRRILQDAQLSEYVDRIEALMTIGGSA